MKRDCIIAAVAMSLVMASCGKEPSPDVLVASAARRPPTDVVVKNTVPPQTLIDFQYESLAAAGEAAVKDCDGCVFIFFYHRDDDGYRLIADGAFQMPKLADYVNENFACMAVDIATAEGGEVLKWFRDDLPHWSFVTVSRPPEWKSRGMHGWRNVESEEDVDFWINTLEGFKEGRSIFEPRTASPAVETE